MPDSQPLAIDIDSVSKTYRGRVRALEDVQLRVHPGEIFGLLGPNGAGKSTLVKILMTIVRASDCRGRLLGEPVGQKSTLARVGYLPEHLRFPDYLRGDQVIDHFGAMAGVPRAARRKRAAELLETVGMTDWATTRVSKYSKGMKQRLGVAQALVNDPDLVLLDEPTDGVDPLGRREIRDIIKKMRDEGKTVFVNSHLLSELEMICDRVAIMVKGRVVSQGAIDELTAESRRFEFRVSVAEGTAEADLVAQALDQHKDAIEYSQGVVRTTVSDVRDIQPMIDALRARDITIHAIQETRHSLEDLFMTAIEGGGGSPGGERGKRRRKKKGGER